MRMWLLVITFSLKLSTQMLTVFSYHEKQLCVVSLELTFLTEGGALVPYEISESTAACEDENVPCKASYSFIKKKKNSFLRKLSAYPS